PNRSGGWPAPQQDEEPGRAGDWAAGAGTPVDRSGGWAVGAGAQQDDPNRSGGWVTAAQDEQPAWGQQGDQAAPAWSAPAEPAARAAAKVPVPGQGENLWAAPDDPARSGGWQADPAGPRDEDPDRSGGWAAGRAAAAAPQPGWGAPDEQRPGWGDASAAPQQRDDESAQPGWAAAGDRPEAGAWASAETPARASASVPSPDSPPAWGGGQDIPAQRTPQRPAIPEAEPWRPGEAWGRAAEAEPAANGWEPNRAEDGPIYQPAPGPGISPANAVPLPPQEQRVPGAALAASPPADYASSNQFGAAEAAERDPQGYEPERSAWGTPEPAREEPQSPAGPVVPAPRTSPESGAVSASASVPMASRVTPPTDQPLHAAGVPAPQPRVYGRPTRPEAEEVPGQDAPNGFPEQGPRFDEHGSQYRPDEPERPNPFAEAPPVSSAPPSSPAGPPPFPPGMPSFMDPAGNNRPVNGVHPQSGERPGDPFGAPGDPFGGPGGQREPFGGPGAFGGPGGHQDQFGGPGGQHDPFGGPGGHQDQFAGPGGHQDQFGAPGGHQDQFGGPGGQHDPFGGPAGGRATAAVPGQGPGEPAPGGFPPAFPPPPQQAPPAWQQGPTGDPQQGRFDAFKPDAEPKTEAPAPKVRNGKVLALVLIAAVLILAVPLGALALLGKLGGDDSKPQPFNPAVGSCIKQSGTTAAAAGCGEPGAFTVVSRVDSKAKCPDPAQPTVTLKNKTNPVLCLKPAGQ
ncbi:LppU/SCO3897 family protein, partial [Micromonospora sp. NPDC003776]